MSRPKRVIKRSLYGPNYMTLAEAANYLRITRMDLRRLIRAKAFREHYSKELPTLVSTIDVLRWERFLPKNYDWWDHPQWAMPV
ncbi:DNA binding domain-containing protein, excisionase family [Sphingomonas jatrophae]|uniref:DNA binding domain-containing protein, excisionase family n=1 Tax=Sphingomonas jatrophae TaxID=1166337 RepID=A0A1I6L2J4_9SPHN|nr:DNA binding domain-containing protein, excisionase family [Sphingomonas jatrophae]